MNKTGSVDWSPADYKRKLLRLLPLMALYVRASVGLSMLTTGLFLMFSKNNPGNNAAFQGAMTPGGLDSLATLIPYVNLALGVGLILGIFTTLSALLASAFSLLGPLLWAISLITTAGIGNGGNSIATVLNQFSIFYQAQGVVTYLLVIALSPLAINRYSIDALIFQKEILPPPEDQVDVDEPKQVESR